jgi:hypothetical protein
LEDETPSFKPFFVDKSLRTAQFSRSNQTARNPCRLIWKTETGFILHAVLHVFAPYLATQRLGGDSTLQLGFHSSPA